MDLKEIIERIGRIRSKSNLSARELSLRIDKNPGYINLLESKQNFEPSLSALLDIIEICGITPEEFFYENLEQYETDKKLLSFFKTLSQYQKEAILNLYKK
ncbi:MAG: helix-turn-helix domain-containing protein [Clostridiales bacterium]|jgi:transcriptional regulator with XRE-family HTH domain|nr:helix-turn-helix domain-containing protein [Clostridiales bacterium]